MINAWQGAECRHGRHRHRERHPPQGLEGLDDRVHPPRLALVVAVLCQTLAARDLLAHSPAVCLADAVLRRGGPTTAASHLRWTGPQVARPG
jgi:hypothetical protein